MSAGALVAGLLIGAAPAHASGSGCDSADRPPSANTWYDQSNNYRGTRSSYRYNTYHLSTVVYETFGPNYYQAEVWFEGGMQPPQRVDCQRKPDTPKPTQPNPQPMNVGGVAGGGVFLPTGGMTIWMSNPVIRTGTVNVGQPTPVDTLVE
ncbi:hypothetical protein FLP10_05940 [Agromyces intestinalis]|uniref:Uncharacterized protein n=1 Tax=Agromyces intestinalis TaxID=2592652 RepID=A0A5C1YD97_9MICO|nr:hypothetical protein [Agromyces intestinalis]QEO14014.1 hypothetical protein FLP10_05940 [Agromyces intestinalis]